MIKKLLLLMFGVFACSTAAILIRVSTEHSILLASYRCLLAAALLSPLLVRDMRRHKVRLTPRALLPAAAAGVTLGVHFITWIIGVRMTLVANGSLIVNLIPVAMPFFLFLLLKERLNRREVIGTILAVSGLLILGSSDFHISMTHLYGDLICFGSMLLFAFYLALGRRYNTMPTVWLYIVPLYVFAGVACFIAALPFVNPIKPYALTDVLPVIGLAAIPTIIGHTTLNYSMRVLRGQLVSILTTTQFIFAGVLSFFILGEVPAPLFYVSSLILFAAVCIVATSHHGRDEA
jgi:drug/metabolite transporter (DMT)-like permease